MSSVKKPQNPPQQTHHKLMLPFFFFANILGYIFKFIQCSAVRAEHNIQLGGGTENNFHIFQASDVLFSCFAFEYIDFITSERITPLQIQKRDMSFLQVAFSTPPKRTVPPQAFFIILNKIKMRGVLQTLRLAKVGRFSVSKARSRLLTQAGLQPLGAFHAAQPGSPTHPLARPPAYRQPRRRALPRSARGRAGQGCPPLPHPPPQRRPLTALTRTGHVRARCNPRSAAPSQAKAQPPRNALDPGRGSAEGEPGGMKPAGDGARPGPRPPT